ncbi:MAG TPA: translation initiation factor IF-2 subunit alpha [Nanoarchaeota archaeon]|nr:translation initiation factor IF-2 subunit alpha [Nanoarchaeota archaeon]
MVYMKKGVPEEGELVLCTVRKILPHSVFVDLVEYGNREAMIHISEIAPGRIRNIRDYVKEDKEVVCKVLQLNRDRGTIDLSLRRVSLQQRLKKEDEFKQEQKSEKILEVVAQKLKTTLQDVYEKAGNKIKEEYGTLTACFHDVSVNGESVLKEMGLPENYVTELFEVIKERIKPPEARVVAELTLESNDESGVEAIRKALKAGETAIKENNYKGGITYNSAPHYRLEITTHDYKESEEAMEKVCNAIIAEIKKAGGSGSFKREE